MLALFFLLMVAHYELEFYMNTGRINLEWHRILLFPTLITLYVYFIAYAIEQCRRDPPLMVNLENLEE